jgi:hypothetical protein
LAAAAFTADCTAVVNFANETTFACAIRPPERLLGSLVGADGILRSRHLRRKLGGDEFLCVGRMSQPVHGELPKLASIRPARDAGRAVQSRKCETVVI